MRHLQAGGHTVVLWNAIPRDFDDPEGWPDRARAQHAAATAPVLMVLHDLPNGAMRQLDRVLGAWQDQGVEFLAEPPDSCVPIRRGVAMPGLADYVAAELGHEAPRAPCRRRGDAIRRGARRGLAGPAGAPYRALRRRHHHRHPGAALRRGAVAGPRPAGGGGQPHRRRRGGRHPGGRPSAPDGYTILFGTSGTMATNPVIMAAIPYDPIRDFAPIVPYAKTSVILGVRPQLGVTDLAGFLALARQRPLSIGTAGTGTTGHLTTALIEMRSGLPLTHVPYRDGSRAVADLLNGTLDAMVYHPLGFLPHIRAGTIRPLAVTGAARHPLFPEVPTLVESGLPGAVVEGWWALYAPAGTPAPIIARVNALVNASLAEPATRAELERQGLEVMGGTPEALAALTRTELAKQREIAQAARITVD